MPKPTSLSRIIPSPVSAATVSRVTVFELIGFALIPGDVIPSLLRLRHLLKTRSTAGVSPFACTQWAVSWWVWAVYGVMISSVPLVIVSVAAAVVDSLYVAVLLRRRDVKLSTVVALAVGGLALVVVGFVTSAEVIAVVVTAVDAVSLLPQMVRVLRDRDVSGVSKSAWTVDLLQDTGWVVYGFGIGHPLLAGWSLFSMPLTVAILAVAVVKSRRTTEAVLGGKVVPDGAGAASSGAKGDSASVTAESPVPASGF